MQSELPSADQVVEELAERVSSRIESGVPVAFDNALDELVDYHRFLLGLSAEAEPNEPASSYAEIEGVGWGRPPHRKWIQQYRRLFERAVDKIPIETSFIQTLSFVPYRLIQPLDEDLKLSPQIVRGILDLGPMLIHSYEAWFTRRSTTQLDANGTSKRALAGSDAKSLGDALRSTVGAWETLLQMAPYELGWREVQGRSEDELWKVYSQSWPMLWAHLANTAYSAAVAVWNEDELAAGLFGEALIRWGNDFHDLPDSYGFRLPHLLFPDLFSQPWDQAKEHALKLAFGSYECTPGSITAEIIKQCKNDVLLMSASLLLHWAISKGRSIWFAPQLAGQLLRQEQNDDDVALGRHEWSLSSAILQILRLGIAGGRFEGGSYAADLDEFLRNLDTMSEREIVPGRVFTPSTLNDREGLLISNVALLAAATTPGQEPMIHPELKEWIDNPDLLPREDASLRSIQHDLDQYLGSLKQSESTVRIGLELLTPAADSPERLNSLRLGIEQTRSSIDRARAERLRKTPIDETKIEERRIHFENALLTPPAEAPFFENVALEKIALSEQATVRTLRFLGIPKERLVEPEMGTPVLNELEVQTAELRNFSGNQVFADLGGRGRVERKSHGEVDSPLFWEEIAPLIQEVGSRPILLISDVARMRLFERIFKADPIEGLHVEKRAITSGRRQYVTTIEGVDVFGGVTKAGSSWLLSRDVIRAVEYSPVATPERFVEVSFVLEDGQSDGVLETKIRQQVRWGDGIIFEIEHPDTPADA